MINTAWQNGITRYQRTDGKTICEECRYRAPIHGYSNPCMAGKIIGTILPICCDLFACAAFHGEAGKERK